VRFDEPFDAQGLCANRGSGKRGGNAEKPGRASSGNSDAGDGGRAVDAAHLAGCVRAPAFSPAGMGSDDADTAPTPPPRNFLPWNSGGTSKEGRKSSRGV